MIRALIPQKVRLRAKILFRSLKDYTSGMAFEFASMKGHIKGEETIRVGQKHGDNNNKLENIRIAGLEINKYIIMPNEVFSFWRIVGNPLSRKGYKKSRTIVLNEVKETIGGGLCQLSGIIYYLSLRLGLTIIERHNHSIDIYAEDERYTPLGSDATIVYGYKDLRIRNNLKGPIQYNIEVREKEIVVSLISEENIMEQVVKFERENVQIGEVVVRTLINGRETCKSIYKRKSV